MPIYKLNSKGMNEWKHIESDITNITMGVPQGYIWGSILFPLYIHDVEQAFPNATFTIVLSEDHLPSLYYAQVESRLSYDICFWGISVNAQSVFFLTITHKMRTWTPPTGESNDVWIAVHSLTPCVFIITTFLKQLTWSCFEWASDRQSLY